MLSPAEQQVEAIKCATSPKYFVSRYVQIESVDQGRWIPFNPWPAQELFLEELQQHQFVIALKARQVGFTWISLAYGLHGQLFRPIYPTMVFSRREREALDLVRRTSGMAQRLPPWLMPTKRTNDSTARIEWANGSWLGAYSSSGGDAQTARLVLVDEAGLQPDLNRLLRSVEPVIEHTGQLILVGRIDKDNPGLYGRMCQAALRGDSRFHFTFIPWWGRPDRSAAWYEEMQAQALALDGTLDDIYEQYPATADEALLGKTLNKRFAPAWFRPPVYERRQPMHAAGAPAIPGARYYVARDQTHRYVVGVDPAEGNPQSDPSPIVVQDDTTGEYVAVVNQRLEPDVTAEYALQLAGYYQRAGIMVERNNHGHAVLQRLLDRAAPQVLQGSRELELPWQEAWQGSDYAQARTSRYGWLNNRRGKITMYTSMAEAVRGGDVRIYDEELMQQLASIDGNTLQAEDNQHDDLATAAALCQVGREAVASIPRLGTLNMRRGS
jgi:hypothetical protein